MRTQFAGASVVALVCFGGSAVAAENSFSSPSTPIKVFAAGSLTGALTAVMQLYKEQTGGTVEAEFGPAGLLRERIEKGERADVFASANMAHPRTLAARGLATPPVVMARNRICAKALPSFGLTSANLLDRMLDPKVGIGTSTPQADPGGDYAWEVFARAGEVRLGARAALEAKAQKLVGGRDNPTVPVGQDAMTYFMQAHRIDLSLGYCSSRKTTPDPNLVSVELPENLAVSADYGLSVLALNPKNREAALRFALFILSPDAQHLISQYGFSPVAESASSN